MNSTAFRFTTRDRRHSTLKRAVVRLPESPGAERLVKTLVSIAFRCRARLRGLTAVDTAELQRLAIECPSAAHLIYATSRLDDQEARRNEVRSYFSQACLSAGLDFDLRRVSGDVMDLIPVESRFHDLFAFSFAAGRKRSVGGFDVADAVQLLIEGTTPTLALREGADVPRRALIILDGSPACARTVHAFLDQGPFELSAVRFLAVARDAGEAQTILREQSDVVRERYPDSEWGYIVGSSKRLAARYAERWQADLVVIGTRRSPPIVRYFFGETVREIMRRTNCSIYAWS